MTISEREAQVAGRPLLPVVPLVVLSALWVLLGRREGVRGDIFPPPWDIGGTVGELVSDYDLVGNLWVTIREIAVAFGIVVVTGVLVGTLIGRVRYLFAVLDPFLAAAYSIPKVILFPIFLIVFGIGTESKVAMGVAHGAFPLLLTTVAAVRTIDAGYLELADSLVVSRTQRLRSFIIPAVRGPIISGLRLSLTLTVVGVLVGELIQSDAGLAHLVFERYTFLDWTGMYAAIVVLLLFVEAIQVLLGGLEWRYRDET